MSNEKIMVRLMVREIRYMFIILVLSLVELQKKKTKQTDVRTCSLYFNILYMLLQMTSDVAYVTSMVRKDVLRTDRHHKFYAGSDDNQNIASLFNILTT